jgi:hypothetical protein
MCYFHTKFEVHAIKITLKIRFLIVLWLGPILNLTFDLDPYHLVWWLLTPWYSYILTMMFLRQKTNKLKKFSFYVMTSPNDVITSTFLLIWKALIETFHICYDTIWYCMVPSISKFDHWVSKFRKQISTRSETPEGHGWSAPKINQLSGSSYATFTPSLELIW